MPLTDEILIAALNDGEINSKIIYSGDEYRDFPTTRIESSFRTDQISSSAFENLMYWYDNYYIASGYQTIKNNNLVEKNKRRVFFINKIAYQ